MRKEEDMKRGGDEKSGQEDREGVDRKREERLGQEEGIMREGWRKRKEVR